MKKNIKKLFFIFFALLGLLSGVNSCFAVDSVSLNLGCDYLITTEDKVKANAVEKPEVLSIKPFYSIFNDKNMLLIHPEKIGKTKLTIFLEGGDQIFDVSIKPKNTPSTPTHYRFKEVEFTLLDEPPIIENFEIDTPPDVRGGN